MKHWAKMVSMFMKTHYLLKDVWSYRLVKYHCCLWEITRFQEVKNWFEISTWNFMCKRNSLVRPWKTTVVLVLNIEYRAGFGETANVNTNWKRSTQDLQKLFCVI